MGITLGDVSGHGLPGAVVMGMAKKVLRLRAQDMPDAPPTEVLAKVNTDLAGELELGTFLTVLYGVLDCEESTFTFARAGHEPPVFLPCGSARPSVLSASGFAIGMVPTALFRREIEELRIELRPGEGIFLISDGILDAENERGVRFGRERLIDTLTDATPADAVRKVIARLNSFSGEASQSDDITAVSFGKDPSED